jgi:hypothetical protein
MVKLLELWDSVVQETRLWGKSLLLSRNPQLERFSSREMR